MTFGGGVYILDVNGDDIEGICGCGKFAFLKLIAEIVKTKDCEPFPCFQ